MTTRIDLPTGPGALPHINGKPIAHPPTLRVEDRHGMPFPGVYLDNNPTYGVEIWSQGNLLARVPPRTPHSEAIYQALTTTALDPRPPRPLSFNADHYRTFKELEDELRVDPGRNAHILWDGVKRTLTVHRANATELRQLLDELASSEQLSIEMFQNTRPDHVRRHINALVDQRVHNYVASAKSLVDHTRRLFNKYPKSHIAAEYDKRRTPITDSPVARFVGDLRNYMLHRSLPFIGNRVSVSTKDGRIDKSFSTRMLLTRRELLADYDAWSRPARTFIDGQGDQIDLATVVADHLTLIDELYEWVFNQYEPLHRADIVATLHLRQEMHYVLTGGRESRPRTAPPPLPKAEEPPTRPRPALPDAAPFRPYCHPPPDMTNQGCR